MASPFTVARSFTLTGLGNLLSLVWVTYSHWFGLLTVIGLGYLLSLVWVTYSPWFGLLTVIGLGYLLSLVWVTYSHWFGLLTAFSAESPISHQLGTRSLRRT